MQLKWTCNILQLFCIFLIGAMKKNQALITVVGCFAYHIKRHIMTAWNFTNYIIS